MINSQEAGLVVVLVLLTVTLTSLAGSHIDRTTGESINNFWNSHTLIQTATDASFFAIMAIGATVVIISSGIDLSVGSIYALSGVAMALLLRNMGAMTSSTTVVVGLGARGLRRKGLLYPVSEAAKRHGVSVPKETTKPEEAYADLTPSRRVRYGGWLP